MSSLTDIRRLLGFALVILATLLPAKAGADHRRKDVAESARAGERPPGTTVPLYTNLGVWHHAVTTASPLAQRYFDQGLRLAYGFNHDEAQRSFEQGARLDSTCAMCWWGVAWTLGPNYNLPAFPDHLASAAVAETKALAAASRATPFERAMIAALTHRYPTPLPANPLEQHAADSAFAAAMRGVAHDFVRDDDAQVIFAEALMDLRPWNLWTPDGKPAPDTPEILATLESVLARTPKHPGANHYYVHATEASPNPERGLAAAGRVAKLEPGAGHLVHMPAHTYIRLGRYEEASAANRRAIVADSVFVAENKDPGFYAMYIIHNHQFLWEAAAMEGRSVEAIAAARAAVAHTPMEMLQMMPGFDLVLSYPSAALARFGKWDAVLHEPVPPGGFAYATAMWHFARGLADARTGALADAQAELDSVDATLAATPPEAIEDLSSAKQLLTVAHGVLRGELLDRQGKTEEALAALRSAVATEDSLHYAEPPDWPMPVRHILGAVLLAHGRAVDAETVYRADLERNRHNGWALFGLMQALQAQGKKSAAAAAATRFHRAWRYADFKLTASRF